MTDLPFVLVGWLGTAAAIAAYTGWIQARIRRLSARKDEDR